MFIYESESALWRLTRTQSCSCSCAGSFALCDPTLLISHPLLLHCALLPLLLALISSRLSLLRFLAACHCYGLCALAPTLAAPYSRSCSLCGFVVLARSAPDLVLMGYACCAWPCISSCSCFCLLVLVAARLSRQSRSHLLCMRLPVRVLWLLLRASPVACS